MDIQQFEANDLVSYKGKEGNICRVFDDGSVEINIPDSKIVSRSDLIPIEITETKLEKHSIFYDKNKECFWNVYFDVIIELKEWINGWKLYIKNKSNDIHSIKLVKYYHEIQQEIRKELSRKQYEI